MSSMEGKMGLMEAKIEGMIDILDGKLQAFFDLLQAKQDNPNTYFEKLIWKAVLGIFYTLAEHRNHYVLALNPL